MTDDLRRLAYADAIEEGGDPETAAAVRQSTPSPCCGRTYPGHCPLCRPAEAPPAACECGRGTADCSVFVGIDGEQARRAGPHEAARQRVLRWLCVSCQDDALAAQREAFPQTPWGPNGGY